MRYNPLSKKEVYDILKKLEPKMKVLDETQSVSLTSQELQLMEKAHDSIRVFSSGQMALKLNTTCGSCVREALSIYSSFYRRLKIEIEAQDVPSYVDDKDNGLVDTYKDQLNENSGFNLNQPTEEPLPSEPVNTNDANEVSMAKSEPEPLEITEADQAPAVEPEAEPVLTGVPLNTEDSQTPAQKAAATRAANKLKKAQEEAE